MLVKLATNAGVDLQLSNIEDIYYTKYKNAIYATWGKIFNKSVSFQNQKSLGVKK